jgi:hypothetical protein
MAKMAFARAIRSINARIVSGAAAECAIIVHVQG